LNIYVLYVFMQYAKGLVQLSKEYYRCFQFEKKKQHNERSQGHASAKSNTEIEGIEEND
jgi:hypothetical protein